jgi:glycolate oxidase FAD binding subunit
MISDLPHQRVAPKRVEELAQSIAECDRAGRSVVIEGGGTLAGVGKPVAGADLAVSTRGLHRILAFEHADLTAAVQAGATLGNLGDALAKYAQFVPIDAPQRRSATIGGTLAAGWLGPRRHTYGRARDYVIGTHAVLADGTIAKAGGMVVKNVTGYDMSKLYIGSFGTLGVIVQVNLKTLPQPAQARVFLAPLVERSRSRAIAHLQTIALAPAAAFWVEGFRRSVDGEDRDEGRLVILLEGSPHLLERATRDLRSALGKAGVPETQIVDAGARECFERVVDAYVANVGERSITYRIAALPENAEARALTLRDLARRFEYAVDSIVDVMNGDIILRASARDARGFATRLEIFDDEVHGLEPRAQIVASASSVRGVLDAWGALPPAIDKMRTLKKLFDPRNTLNPGRFVGGI